MRILLKLFGAYQKYLPGGKERDSVEMDLPESTRIIDLLSSLGLPNDDPRVILINGIGAVPEQTLKEGDVIAVFQSIAGGSNP